MYEINGESKSKTIVLDVDQIKKAELDEENNFPVLIKYLLAGTFFGIIFLKAEIISWFRIQEMFRLQSFFMYGVIGSAVIVGMISIYLIRKFQLKAMDGQKIEIQDKAYDKGKIVGGLIFGMGWAMTGACPGPLFAQMGSGHTVILVSILSAVAGTWIYGYFRNKLPH